LRSVSGANTWTGAITLASDSRINSDAATLTVSGTISGSGQNLTLGGAGNLTVSGAINTGSGSLSKDGAGTVTLSGPNTYTGSTVINPGGALNIRNGSALGGTASGTTVYFTGAALEVQGGITTAEPLTLNGTGVSSGGALRSISGDNTVSGPITLGTDSRINSDAGTLTISGGISASDKNLTLGGAGNHVINSVIATGAGNLIKDGAGTATLSAANTVRGSATVNNGTLELGAVNAFSSATVTSGTLKLSANGALGSATGVSVSGGTLLLSGSTLTDRIKDSATITLGGGTLHTGGNSENVGVLTLSASSVIDMGAGSGSVLRFADSSAASWTGILSVWNWTGVAGDGGSGDQLFFGTTGTGLTGSQLAEIRFYSDSGITPLTVALSPLLLCTGEVVPVPEPGTWLAAASALALLAWRERRRLRNAFRQFARKH
jgi:autotransporter-associated beta strand protein